MRRTDPTATASLPSSRRRRLYAERAVSKEARLVAIITDLLVGRGASADEAALVARTAWGVLAHAIGAWRAAPGTPLQQHVNRGFTLLSGLVSA